MSLCFVESNGQTIARLHVYAAPLQAVVSKLVRIKSAGSGIHGQEANAAFATTFNVRLVQTIRDVNLSHAEHLAFRPAAKKPEWPRRRERAQGQIASEAGSETANHNRPTGSRSITLSR